MINKQIGNEYENKLLSLLQRRGYWCHLFAYKQNGQPCDVIASKNNETFLIDVKHCEEDRFDFKNIQPNQITCFEYNMMCGNTDNGFAIWFEKQQNWYWLPYFMVKNLMDEGKKSVRYENLKLLEVWKL